MSSELSEPVPFIDLSATITKDKKTVYLHIVNRHEMEASEMEVTFRKFAPKKASHQYVAGKTVEDRNTLDKPENVRIEKASVEIKGDKVLLDLPPHSVNVLKILG